MGKSKKTSKRNVLCTNWGSNSLKPQKYGVLTRKKVQLEADAVQEQILKGMF